MQSERKRWITQAVVAGVLLTGVWGIGSIVEPDPGSGAERPQSRQVQCSAPSHLTMTYTCTDRG